MIFQPPAPAVHHRPFHEPGPDSDTKDIGDGGMLEDDEVDARSGNDEFGHLAAGVRQEVTLPRPVHLDEDMTEGGRVSGIGGSHGAGVSVLGKGDRPEDPPITQGTPL
jgi:hypothetical protein